MIRTIKKLFIGSVVVAASFLPINSLIGTSNFVVEKANAQTQTTGTTEQAKGSEENNEKTLEGLIRILNLVLKVMYILLWPLLAIAGISMDNGFINGEWFHMDYALWRFWNIIKVFSYYSLGFIFVLSIFLHFFNGKSDKFKPTKVIPKLFLGGVGIAFSWFIMKVLLDFSTILTYGLGGMPLSVIGDTTLDKYILATESTFNLNEMGSYLASGSKDLEFNYKCGENKYLSCVYTNGEFDKEEFEKQRNAAGDGFSSQYCTNANMLLPVSGHNINDKEINTISQESMKEQKCPQISTLLEKSRGFTGPFFGLVGSLLNIGTLVMTPTNKTVASLGVEFLIKSIIGIALIVPLLVLSIILVVRVVVIWMITAFSPVIILSEIFGFKLGGDKATLSSILGLIFLPVSAVFAVSISLVFMSLLINAQPQQATDGTKQSDQLASFGMTLVEEKDGLKCYQTVLGNKICMQSSNTDSGISFTLNNFSWLLINLLGVALMWSIVFASLKTSKVTNNIVSGVESFAKSTMKTLPVIPAPGGGLSIGAVQQGMSYTRGLPDRLIQKNYSDRVQPYVSGIQEKMSGEREKDGGLFNNYLSSGNRNDDAFIKALKEFSSRNTTGTFNDYQSAKQALSKFTKESGLNETSDIVEALRNETFRSILINNGVDIEELVIGKNKINAEEIRQELRKIDPTMLSSKKTDDGESETQILIQANDNKILFDGKNYFIVDKDTNKKGQFEDNDGGIADLVTEWNKLTNSNITSDDIKKSKKK